jgi:hypothetical protein
MLSIRQILGRVRAAEGCFLLTVRRESWRCKEITQDWLLAWLKDVPKSLNILKKTDVCRKTEVNW